MFRFTIRDVLWLMVVVGMASGWWNAETKRHEKYDQAVQVLKVENDELRHKEWQLSVERDRLIEANKEHRFFGRP